MKKQWFIFLVLCASCTLQEELGKSSAEDNTAFIASIQGSWRHGTENFIFLPSSNGDIVYKKPSSSSYFSSYFHHADSSSSAVYKVGTSYMGVKIQGNNLYYSGYASSLSGATYSNMTLWAVRSSTVSSNISPTNIPSPTNGAGYFPEDPAETVPSLHNETFLQNLRLPYAYRDGSYFFKIAGNGDFTSHKTEGGTLYRFYTALNARRALYRNETKTQFYALEIDTDGNIKRSPASGTENTAPTVLFAYRSDEHFDDIFYSTLAGRYESRGRFFTVPSSGIFRIQDDLYNPVRILSKTDAVYERFGEFYGLRVSNGQIYIADNARGMDRTNQAWTNSSILSLAQRYTGIASDTASTFLGFNDRERFLENISGKSFYELYNGSTNGYFRAAGNGDLFWQGVKNGAYRRYTLSYVMSPARAAYGSTQLVIDPFGNIRIRGSIYTLYYFTTYDYETAFWTAVSYSRELIYNGESYNLIRIADPNRGVYQKLYNGLYYGITVSSSGNVSRIWGSFSNPEQIYWD